MIAGINQKKPELYTSDITGNYLSYYANAIGEDDDKIKEILREKYTQDLTMKKGVKLALDIFKEIKGDKFNINKFELSYISSEDGKVNNIYEDKLDEFVK